MPKGIPKASGRAALARIGNLLVPPGAKFLPDSESATQPKGIPIPDGIRVRTDRGVEIRFVYDGERISETVRGRPTVAFVLEVARKRDRVRQLIGLGKFGDAEYEEEFPGSPRVAARKAKDSPELTVGKALDAWMEAQMGTIGPNTERDYELAIRNQLKPFKLRTGAFSAADYIPFSKDATPDESLGRSRYAGGPVRAVDPRDHRVLGQLPVTSMSDTTISSIRNQMLADGLGVKRINNLMAPLRGAMDRLVSLRLLSVNPFALVKPLKKSAAQTHGKRRGKVEESLDAPLPSSAAAVFSANEGDPDPFSTDEIEAILRYVDPSIRNQLAFAFYSGLRSGEIMALRVNDLQLDKNRILVRRSLSRGILKSTKTDQQRWVDLLPPAKAAIEAQIALLGAPDGWVFPNPFTGKRWANESKITRRWTTALKKAGIRYRRPYQTRHTYASLMLSAGEKVLYVAEQMGHADWSMLIKVYGRWLASGSVETPGGLMAQAQAGSWARLIPLMTRG